MPVDDITTERIRETIKRAGWHISLVGGGPVPVYAHTIGLSEHRGYELIWAGGAYFARNQVMTIINTAGTLILEHGSFDFRGDDFTLGDVDESWARLLARQAYSFLGASELVFKQVVPLTHRTLDIPDLARPYRPEGVWRWLTEPWPFSVARSAQVSTDLHVLSGDAVTEAERWEESLFAAHGPKVHRDADLRQAALGTLLTLDPSCEPIVGLSVGHCVTRADAHAPWGEPFDLLDKPL